MVEFDVIFMTIRNEIVQGCQEDTITAALAHIAVIAPKIAALTLCIELNMILASRPGINPNPSQATILAQVLSSSLPVWRAEKGEKQSNGGIPRQLPVILLANSLGDGFSRQGSKLT